MVTVIIPCYNSAKFVNKAIDSVIKQAYTDWKIIAVDDCSADNTFDVLQSYVNEKICVIKNDVNLGVGMSRRNALKDVDTEFVTFLDSDDEFEPEYLEMLINIQKSCNADIVYSRVKLHFDDPKLKNYDPTNQHLLTECMMTGSGRMQTQIDMRQMKFVTGKLYRSEIFTKFDFSDKRIGEDVISLFQACYYSNSVRTTSYAGYIHNYRAGSLLANNLSLMKQYCYSALLNMELVDFMEGKDIDNIRQYYIKFIHVSHQSAVNAIKKKIITKKDYKNNLSLWNDCCKWYKNHEKEILEIIR